MRVSGASTRTIKRVIDNKAKRRQDETKKSNEEEAR